MTGDRRRRWRWRNVPVPEPHVAGLLVGLALHARRPWRMRRHRRALGLVGWCLVGVGGLLAAWAVRTVGEVDVGRPTALVTTGPYAVSRNPMYVAWTALYAGVALVANAVWLLVLLPAVAATVHSAVRREERSLERTFGDEYRAYARRVPRYR